MSFFICNLTLINIFKDIALGFFVVVVLEMLLDEWFSNFLNLSNFKTKPHCRTHRMEKQKPNVYKIIIISLRALKVFGIRCQSIFRKGICPMYLLSHHLFSHRILIYLWHSRASLQPVGQPSICDPIKHDTPCPTVEWKMFRILDASSNPIHKLLINWLYLRQFLMSWCVVN